MQPSAAVYVTYQRKEDAGKAIHAVDGSVMAGRILRYFNSTYTAKKEKKSFVFTPLK